MYEKLRIENYTAVCVCVLFLKMYFNKELKKNETFYKSTQKTTKRLSLF